MTKKQIEQIVSETINSLFYTTGSTEGDAAEGDTSRALWLYWGGALAGGGYSYPPKVLNRMKGILKHIIAVASIVLVFICLYFLALFMWAWVR